MHKCLRCGHILTNKQSIERGYGKTCYRIINLQKAEEPKPDMKEIKKLITSEIQKVLKEFNFNKPIIHNNTGDNGIVPIRIAKMPKFNPFEVNKRLVVKELKEQLAKGIDNVLKEVGSFDEEINFLEPVGVSA